MSDVNPENFFLDLQQAAADILDADAYFDGIPILTEQLGDLENALSIVMSKIGLCVIIETPFATVNAPNVAAINFDDIPLIVTIWEDTVIQRPDGADINTKHHTGCALVALWLLTHARPTLNGEQIANCFVPAAPTMTDLRSVIDSKEFPNVQGTQLKFRCSAGFVYPPQATLLDGNNQALLDGMGIRLTTPRPVTK